MEMESRRKPFTKINTFMDSEKTQDHNIEKKCAMKVADIFKKKGEVFFRLQEEKEVLESLKQKESIIALGGGAFMNKNLRNEILKSSISIWLDLKLKILNMRIKWNKRRTLLNNEKNA